MKRRALSFIVTLALCLNLCPVWVLAADEGTSEGLCTHHPAHTEECGYVSDDPSAPCTFVCPICPIEERIGKLPASVSADNREQIQAQLNEIFDLYEELTSDEQQLVDISPCASLLDELESEVLEPEALESEVLETEALESEALESEVLESEALETEVLESEVLESEALETEVLETEVLEAEVQSEASSDNPPPLVLDGDQSFDTPFEVSFPYTIDTNGHTITGTGSAAILVTASGDLNLKGTVVSKKGAGVEVSGSGSLRIAEQAEISGQTYALDIASGAAVYLSAGKYTGKVAAIHMESGNFASLLASGCAYFGESGAPIPLADVEEARTVIVKQCTDHSSKYTPNAGSPTHAWTCEYCGTGVKKEKCTFEFNGNTSASCGEQCGHSIDITVDESALGDLIYNGADQTANVTLIVKLEDGTALTKDTDYTVDCSARTDVGDITVTVTGLTFNGTFVKTYHINPDQPGIKWDAAEKELEYDGRRTTIKDELPNITITIKAPNNEDLHPYLQYSYKKTGDTEFTDGLPLDVGEYEIKAYLRKSQNYEAAETNPLLKLTIKAIDPVTDAPEAAKPTYNGSPQALVTAGTVDSRATGAEILFATSENGEYSTTIPTSTNAGDYEVWYKVEGTGNYNAVAPTKIDDVKILRKPITPFVTLSDYTYQYDGGDKQPKVTVKDDDNVTVLLDTEYQVVYKDNRDVGTATVEVSDKPLGNYAIETVEVPFQITAKTQEALSITGQRDTVTYGDKFVLGTSGGSGNGVITWKITSGSDVATVDQASGQITIIGHGQATVQATKSGKDPATNVTNYEDATASWIFTADQKPVVATVTAEDKTYNGDKVATVHAVVEQGVLAGDEITITGLTGTFGDENAGADKIVTVDTSNPTIGGTNYEHYDISFSGAAVKATIHKAVVHITTPPNAANLTYNGTAQELIDASVLAVDTAGVLVEYALSEDGPYSTAIPKGTGAGTYTVWYRVQETNNYTGQAPAKVDVTIAQKQVTPAITLSGDGLTVEADGSYSYIYDGNAKEPVVTLYEADGTTVIPTGEYTVSYSNNTNVGNATVTVTAKAGGNYSFTPVTKIFTISKEKAQVVTAPEAAGDPLTFNTRAQRLVTTGTGSGGTMVYSKDNVTFTDQIPTETNAGDYTVHYKVEGDSNHSDSDVGSVTVTIAPKTVKAPTIELLDDNGAALVSYTYDGNAKEPTVVVKDGSTLINADEYNIIYSDNVDAGRATVSITDKPGGNYTVTGSTTFVILKADIVFTQDPADAGRVYNGKPQELLNPGVTSGGTVMYALGSATSTYTDAIPTATEAGTYTIYYKVVGDKNHNDFAAQSVFGTIQRKQLTAITIELDPISFVYDGTVKMPEVTVKDGSTVLPKSEYTVTYSDNNPTNQGTYTITITGAAGGNYDLAGVTANTATFTIGQTAQAELVIEDKPDSTIYGDTFQLTTSGGSSASAVTWEATGPATVNQTTGDVAITGVGEVTIMATNPGDQNYIPVEAKWTFTAAPKAVTASIVVADRDYDGTTDATVSSADIDADLLPGDTVTITTASITAEFDTASVGTGKTVTLDTSNVQVSGADAAKYDISYPDTIKGSITPKNVTVTVKLSDHDLQPDDNGDYFYAYDGIAKTPAVTVTADDGAELAPSDYTVSYSGNKNVGTAAVTIKNAADGNYTFTDKTVNFFIRSTGAVLTSTPQAKDLTYNGTAQDLVTVGTATGGTVLYSDTGAANSYSETIPQGKNAATYTVYYMVKGDANHTDTAPGQVSVTIKPKEITPAITLSQASYVYDGTARTPDVTVKDGTDTIDPGEYTVSYRDNTNAGTATVIVSNNNGGNYIVNGTASFEITEAAPTFTAPTGKTDLEYNGELQELVAAGICSEGTVVYSLNGGNYSAAIPTASAVGTYTVDYKVLGDANHSDTASSQLTVSIAKNRVTNPTITLSSDTFRYNGSQQKPTITVYDDSGNVIPEREYTVTITGNNGNNMVDVDTYTITITTADSSNYVISSSNTRTYKIVEAEQETISITGTKAQVFYGDTIQLGTSGGTGSETITWTVTANDGSTVNSRIGTTGLLTVKDVGGPFTVTVKRSAGGNYKDVSATWEFSAAKKQVTAVVTADDRPYAAGDKSVTVRASVPDSELVPDDSITIKDVTGTFDDPNVGTNKRVTVDSTNASATGTNAENYEITYPATTTASILAQAATVDTDPTPNSLTYDASQAQELVTAGTVTGGTMVYSLDGSNFTPAIPKAKDAGTYTVHFKARGDGNHTDSAVGTKPVTIAQQTVTPQIELSPSSVQYDGNVKEPEVTVRDAANNVIPNGEYTVIYDSGTNWKDVGAHKVTVKNAAGGNYIITETDKTFTISTTPQNPLEIVNKPGLVYYGDTFTLSAVGGSGSAAVTWSVDNANVVAIDANGFVKIIGTGSAKIKATKPGGTNYDAVEAEYPLNALKKPVTAIVTADDKVYDGTTTATIHVAWKDGGLVGNDTIDTSSLTGAFADEKVGTNKKVTITGTPASDTTSQKYDITIPATTTASILKADTAAPAVAANDRDYDGTAQSLVTGGSANTAYSDARDGVYSTTVPTGTNAGTYTVWYKEKGDANHNDSAPQSVTVTISRKTLTLTPADITLSGNDLQDDGSGNYSYEYDGTEKKPTVTIVDGAAVIPASEYTVTYSGNKNVGTATVTITSNAGGNYTFADKAVNFEIRKSAAQLTSSPQAKDLTYTGQPQELVTVGVVSGGHIEYLQSDGTYSSSIPAETNAGTYTVTYKVVGDGNYEDSADTWTVSVTIKPKEIVSPKITVSGSYIYDGSEQKPAGNAVTVEDSGTSIPDTEYTLSYRDNVSAGTATVVVSDNNGGNYTVNGAATFTIAKADVKASDITAPNGKTNLPYNGAAQNLVTAGKASGGTMVYALSQNGEYSPVIPAQTAVDDYTVWYKVQGDSNHNDTTPASVPASIIVNNVANPTVQVTPETVKYNGQKQEPTFTVRDDKDGHLIDGSEYTVTYTDADGNSITNLTSVGKYTLTITGTDTHYTFTATAIFEIRPADQTLLTITGTRERVYYGDTIQLGTTGGSGTVEWSVDNSSIASINNGLLTITGVGSVRVTATSKAAGYADQTATWPFVAEKKLVTAVVTAAPKIYNGNMDAAVTATLQSSDLVNGDTVKITLSGSFEDPNAGTDKKVTVDSTNPNFAGSTGNYQNYSITYPATTTASILKADIAADTVTAPTAETDLEYTGIAQTLVTAGDVTGGTMEYSLDGKTYSAGLPTGTDAGGYDIWYRVKGDGNHNDTEGTKLSSQVTIAQQTVDAPIIEFTPSGASYDGAVHKPAVAVKDKNHRVIPAEEYTVTYGGTDWKTAGDHEVTIAGKTGGNYNITTKTEKFTISQMGQNPLSIVNQPGRVQYGDTFTLSTSGGSGTGAVTWDSTDKTVATISDNGLVKVLKSGAATITATKAADDNYGATTVEWSFSAEKKPVTAIVTADDKVYDGSNSATIHVAWKDGDLLNGDTINLTLTGTFNNANAGNNKPVTITGTVPNSDKYAITYNAAATASITPKAASVSGATATELTYDGSEQELVSNVTAANGTLAYSRDGSYYTLNVPKETNAGKYTIWYKAQAEADGNYKDSPAVRVDVTIKPKTVMSPEIVLSSETFDYDGTAKKPDVVVKDGNNVIHASEYTVSYSDNTAVGIATVIISDNAGGNYTVGTQTATFTIKAGAPALTAEPQPRNLTYNGREQTLVTRGTAVNGRVLYSLDEYDDYSTTIPKKTNAGTYEVWYKVEGDDGTETDPESVIAEILPKLVTPVVTVNLASDPLPYTGSPQKPPVTVAVGSETLNEQVDYTITYSNNTNVGTATIAIQSINGSNYEFYTTRTFEIAKTKAAFAVEPKGKEDLRYTGEPQVLIEENTGISLEGVVLYSRDTVTYSAVKPTETKVGSYTIFAKVQGDSTHEDSEVKIITATISRNTVNSPTVTLSASSFPYTGSEQKPTVTVADDEGNEISADEYTVTYSNNVNVGTARISIKSKAAGNYSFTAAAEFQIVDASQTPLAITGRKDDVYYGDTLSLGTTGGGSGAVTWSSSNTDVAGIDSNGTVKIKASGSVTITATKGSDTATWPFYAKAKPVTAVVTAADKPYDGNNTAALTVTISSGLLPGDSISTNTDNGVKATGHFTDASVGPNKIVVIDALTIPDSVSEKYDISCLATTTASITQAAAKVTNAPAKAGSLTYNGSPQPLLTSGGTADGGNLAYSVDGGKSYSFDIPTGTDAGSYTVWYKVVAGDENHKDSAPVKLDSVTIAANTDTPTVLCTPGTFQYDGTEKTPTDVVVRDRAQRIIPESEYTVTLPANRVAVGTYTVTITDKPGGNYSFTDPVTGTFEIVKAGQSLLSIITDKPTDVYYGDTFRLSAMGGSGSGAIVWSITGNTSAAKITSTSGNNCVVTVTGTDGFTVEAYRAAADGYSQSNTDYVPFVANPKPVTPVVTAENKLYDGTTDAKLKATWKSGDLMNGDTINLDAILTGTFDSATVGTNKRVTFTVPEGLSGKYGNYYITWPDSTTASIDKVDAKLNAKPTAYSLTYDGTAQALVTGGTTVNNIGTIEYSLSQNGAYSENIPTAKNAGKYTVWYKVADSVNYTGVPAASVEVEIAKATPTISTKPTASTGTEGQSLKEITFSNGGSASVVGKFAWKDDSIKPEVGKSQQYVIFTPDDTANYNAVEIQIEVTIQSAAGTDSTNSGGSSTANSGSGADNASGSTSNTLAQGPDVVIKQDISSDATKAQFSIPVSTVNQIQSEPNAALTFSSPIADVTIPNAALDTLGRAGGTVDVVTEQVDQGVALTLTAGGEKVENIPGGVTLSVPAEDAGPGTVAVLVHDDGTRETIQKSVTKDGVMNIPLNGSATVEIVDNSKEFTDVPSTSWAADAVAFASAHELFSGTSETTFSPDQAMSRGMLTTVLYNLEGRPDQDLTMQDLTSGYSDVSSDAWYAEGVAWASENGIVSGYGDGQFNPDDSITREQFAVMLWRYAGSPQASGQALAFTDADQASGYAQEALCWAVEKGILNGYANGRLAPGGTATRAEAAQMLKNFMEST